MEKPIELIEMPFISENGDKHICGICGGCALCKAEIDHQVGYIAHVATIF